MRQAFLSFPWVHAPAPKEFFEYFRQYGTYRKLPAYCAIYNGGVDGEVAWILSGLCTYRLQDSEGDEHFMTLVPAGRLIGNVDAYTASVVNVLDYALRPSEVLLMPRRRFAEILAADRNLESMHSYLVIRDHESDMEGFFSRSADRLEERIAKLFCSLIFLDEERDTFDWDRRLENYTPLAIPYDLSNTEIAKCVAASRTAVSLVVNEWKRAGLLTQSNGRLVVERALLDLIVDWKSTKMTYSSHVRKRRSRK